MSELTEKYFATAQPRYLNKYCERPYYLTMNRGLVELQAWQYAALIAKIENGENKKAEREEMNKEKFFAFFTKCFSARGYTGFYIPCHIQFSLEYRQSGRNIVEINGDVIKKECIKNEAFMNRLVEKNNAVYCEFLAEIEKETQRKNIAVITYEEQKENCFANILLEDIKELIKNLFEADLAEIEEKENKK